MSLGKKVTDRSISVQNKTWNVIAYHKIMSAKERYTQLITDGKNIAHDSGTKPVQEFNQDLIQQGCWAFQKHFFSMFVGMLTGLLSLMYVPSIVKVLDNTNQSGTSEKAFTRYLTTLNHVIQWYQSSPDQRLQSLKTVRRTHAKVAKSNVMTQYDMVVTQWAFIGNVQLFVNLTFSFCTLGGATK